MAQENFGKPQQALSQSQGCVFPQTFFSAFIVRFAGFAEQKNGILDLLEPSGRTSLYKSLWMFILAMFCWKLLTGKQYG